MTISLLQDHAHVSALSYFLHREAGDLLQEAEAMFGVRDPSWTLGRIRFWTGCNHTRYMSEHEIDIWLGSICLDRIENAYYQLAHECVHLLSPKYRMLNSSVLEEGLAVFFSNHILRENFNLDWSDYEDQDVKYREALLLVTPLSEKKGSIKVLREEQPIISDITAEIILRHYPEMEGLAHQLAQTFYPSGT